MITDLFKREEQSGVSPDGSAHAPVSIQELAKGLTLEDYLSLLSALNKLAIVSVTDAKGTIIYANEKFVEVSKYPLVEILGQNHRILKSGRQPQSMFIELWKTISSGRAWRGEIQNRAKDGTYYWVDTSIAPIIGASGKPERYVAVRFLISDKKEIETELAVKAASLEESRQALLNVLDDLNVERNRAVEEKARTETLLASIGDGVIAADVAGVVTFINDSALTMLALRREDALNKDARSLFTVELDDKPLSKEEHLISRVLAERVSITTDPKKTLSFITIGGRKFPVSATAAPVLSGEKLIGAIKTFRDISVEKEVDRVKSEFVSLASHQLRTPLSTINWYAEMLTAGDAGALSAEQQKYVEEIYRGNQRMVELVNALLNVSRLELGTFVVDPLPTDIVKLAKDVVQELEPKIFARKIDFVERYADSIPNMSVDPNLMRIIFTNVTSNAVKYTPENGRVTLDLHTEGAGESGKLVMEVSDTGYGIPKEAHDKIFTKLYRADNVRIRETDGTGLGLYLVKSILEKTGGSISFVSEENKGTTFHIELPLAGMRKKEGAKTLGS